MTKPQHQPGEPPPEPALMKNSLTLGLSGSPSIRKISMKPTARARTRTPNPGPGPMIQNLVAEQTPAAVRHSRLHTWSLILTGWAIATVCVAILASATVFVRYNFHVVRPGQLYRCAQLPDHAWPEVLDHYGVRSVINLRGEHPERHWYQAEKQAAEQRNVVHVDLSLNRHNLPDPAAVEQLLAWHASLPRPVLIHCESGADRTSMATVLWLLLEEGASLTEAQQQMGWRYLQLPWRDGTRQLQRLLRHYEAWLTQNRTSHQPQLFRRWLAEEYRAIYESGQLNRPSPPIIPMVQD
jgi:protein tyrosine phosphatase (PTP) superfamily phosphohydrolase (DUF442 family)